MNTPRKALYLTLFICTFFSFNAYAMLYKAAGVLPYAKNDQGEVCILLGSSSVHKGHASDFGGNADMLDGNDPLKTAAREGCEELMFLLDSENTFAKLLEIKREYAKKFDITKIQSKTYNILCKKIHKVTPALIAQSQGYVMFFIPLDYNEHLPEIFTKRKQQFAGNIPHSWNETIRLSWVPLKDIFAALDNRTSNAPVEVGNCKLYEPFAQSLLAVRKQWALLS